ncbi:glycosyltransferase [Aminobacter anthyllidis]|uniref:Glycosyltransferase n=1 Tax=Aminobacter anthyllidis TaxID=1035067 RepID=A0A9X1D3W2_9HYPH|nr:glycosyltransferase [Aminobacter anthyllidis]MBT1154008.1 glycosyltransferase [Aminobacter anthyllidis]
MRWFDVFARLAGWPEARRPQEPIGFPIAILSFDRPHYLRRTLNSLRSQIGETDHVVLFQDGSWNPKSRRIKADSRDIERCISIFRRIIPWGEIRQAPENLGIALNYERAERHLFEARGAEKALFLEDDLVLSPNYLGVIQQLLAIAEQDHRIGYVSAYGNLWASQSEQQARWHDLIPMHENWGAATTRRAWLAERPFRQAYLALVQSCDYSERDHAAIKAFYAGRGWATGITSQDAARWVACLERGEVRVSSFACHARYIGKHGEHFTPRQFKASRLGNTVMFRGSLPDLKGPTDQQISDWLGTEQARFQGTGQPFYRGHGQ